MRRGEKGEPEVFRKSEKGPADANRGRPGSCVSRYCSVCALFAGPADVDDGPRAFAAKPRDVRTVPKFFQVLPFDSNTLID